MAEILALMAEMPEAPGHSDVGARNLLYTFVISLRPRRVLEVGTHMGSAAVVIGSALKINGYGTLLTLEPQPHYQEIARKNIECAGLTNLVTIVQSYLRRRMQGNSEGEQDAVRDHIH